MEGKRLKVGGIVRLWVECNNIAMKPQDNRATGTETDSGKKVGWGKLVKGTFHVEGCAD